MPATQYKIWAVGGPVGVGATHSLHVGIAGIAKAASADLPYVVANELLCSLLARSILLPGPPGFIIEHNARSHYVSLNFLLAGEDLPPADTEALVAAHPTIASAIVLFDIWIVNDDRHASNIAFDVDSNRIHVFDHSHAFFADGPNRLTAVTNNLGIGDHCLASRLPSIDGMLEWNERIRQVPEFFIRECVQAASEVGLPADQVEFCSTFLLERRRRLMQLVYDHRTSFPLVDAGAWGQLNTAGEPS